MKVQRPGIQRVIEVDLEIMLHLATLMERHVEELALHRPVKIVEEFARTLEKEVDYSIEAASTERFASQFLDDPQVYIPKVFRDVSTPRVLTTEFVDGIKVSEIDRLHAAGLDQKLITDRGADALLKQIFDHGFFQADPHPGNIFVLPGNVICLIDFGMIGTVNRKTRENFVDLIDGVVRKDSSGTAQVFLKLTLWDKEPDLRLFESDVSDFMTKHLYKPLKDIEIGKLLHQLLELASGHRLRIPPDIFFMLKAYQDSKNWSVIFLTAVVAAAIKLSNLLLPGTYAFDILKPAMAIMTESLAVIVLLSIIESRVFQRYIIKEIE